MAAAGCAPTHWFLPGPAAFVLVAALGGNSDDQYRIAAQVVSGIGFIGAGVIFRRVCRLGGVDGRRLRSQQD